MIILGIVGAIVGGFIAAEAFRGPQMLAMMDMTADEMVAGA